MTKLTLEEVYEKIPERFKGKIEIVEYSSYNKMIIKTIYGLSRMSLYNLERLENFNIRSALNKTEFFKNMLLERYPDYEKHFTIIGEFTRSNQGILVKGKYCTHLIKPDILLTGALPHIRNATNPTEYAINYLNELHNNRYTYPNFEYCGSSCMVKINCELHGEFIQKYYVHAMSSGCQGCADDNRVTGYSRSDFIKNSKGRECMLYILKCKNKDEEFYKVGITSHNVKKRYGEKKKMPYDYKIIYQYSSLDAGHIWDLELECKRNYRLLKYIPNIYFKGGTSECFTLDLPIEEIISYLESIQIKVGK